MRIQIGDHAANGGVQKLCVIERLDIFALDALHDLGEQLSLLHGALVVVDRRPVFHEAAANGQAEPHDGADHYNQNCSGFQQHTRLLRTRHCFPPGQVF